MPATIMSRFTTTAKGRIATPQLMRVVAPETITKTTTRMLREVMGTRTVL